MNSYADQLVKAEIDYRLERMQGSPRPVAARRASIRSRRVRRHHQPAVPAAPGQ